MHLLKQASTPYHRLARTSRGYVFDCRPAKRSPTSFTPLNVPGCIRFPSIGIARPLETAAWCNPNTAAMQRMRD